MARVIAFHDVPSETAFRRVIAALPQPAEKSHSSRRRRPPLITFDDGHHSVVEKALPVLIEFRVKATLFVCPGLVQSGSAFWWDHVRSTPSEDLPDTLRRQEDPARWLKRQPDEVRREVLASLPPPKDLSRRSLNEAELRRWIGSGMEVGSHTWDHPCLDQCTPEEQVRQVTHAHEWLLSFTGEPPTSFAYPNGDWAQPTEDALIALGYDEAYLFDHRVGTRRQHPLRRSRLKLDASASPIRTRLIASGIHPRLMHGRDALKRSLPGRRSR